MIADEERRRIAAVHPREVDRLLDAVLKAVLAHPDPMAIIELAAERIGAGTPAPNRGPGQPAKPDKQAIDEARRLLTNGIAHADAVHLAACRFAVDGSTPASRHRIARKLQPKKVGQ